MFTQPYTLFPVQNATQTGTIACELPPQFYTDPNFLTSPPTLDLGTRSVTPYPQKPYLYP